MHTCCAICAAGLVQALKDRFFITLFFYNPNIQPKAEYARRKGATEKLASYFGLDFEEGEYQPDVWLSLVKGYGKEPEAGQRCLICFRDRLTKTAELAKKEQADFFTSTLLASHQKNEQAIIILGQVIGQEQGVNFASLADLGLDKKALAISARKISQELGLYRQKYCGCIFSK